MQDNLSKLTSFYGLGGATATTNDRIEVCRSSCECTDGVGGVFNVDGVGATLTLNPNTLRPPRLIANGLHYEVCYKKMLSTGNLLTLPLGQTYIHKPLVYVYPFNRGIIMNVLTTFVGSGGDLASGDEIVFTSAPDCSLIDAPLTTYHKVTFTR